MFIKMKPQFIMSQADIDALENLPPNFPETHLTQKQKDTVNSIYFRYVSAKSVNKFLLHELYETEQKTERWPGGEKVKRHEAQRLVLDWLVEFNKKTVLTTEEASKLFFFNLDTCQANRLLVSGIFDVQR